MHRIKLFCVFPWHLTLKYSFALKNVFINIAKKFSDTNLCLKIVSLFLLKYPHSSIVPEAAILKFSLLNAWQPLTKVISIGQILPLPKA